MLLTPAKITSYISRIVSEFVLASTTTVRNNYKLNDLTKMDLHFYAVKVGQSSLSDLDIENELELKGVSGEGKNPDYPIDDSRSAMPLKRRSLMSFDSSLLIARNS